MMTGHRWNNFKKEPFSGAFHELWLASQPFPGKRDLISVVHALVKLDYCNVLYIGLPLKNLEPRGKEE